MTYDILQDIYFTNFLNSKPTLSNESIKSYKRILRKFSKSNKKTLSEIIINCKTQQDRIIEKIINNGADENGNQIIEKELIRFDVNGPDSKVKQYINKHIEYCLKKGNSNRTINSNIVLIKAFLRFYNITLPQIETLEDDTKKWNLLTKEDFKYVINDSTITHSSLIKFLMSSGMRISDALSLTIGDFMEATKEYHRFVDVNDFVDNAPENMIGTWYFHPAKTIKFKIPCLTFNDPESSNLILQNLRKIKKHVSRSINKTDALFGSQKKNFKKSITPSSVAVEFWRKNQKLYDYRVLQINEKIQNGELSREDFNKEVDKIPRFHAHGLRKFFQTTIARNCGNLRICTLMEGHVSPVKTDSSYIQITAEEVKEVYLSALPDLSLSNMETKVYTSDIRREMESKINDLESKNQELESKLDEYSSFEERLRALEENRPSWNEFIKGD